MQWIQAMINDLAPWKYALAHGHPDRPTGEPVLPESLPEETMAQVWTVGSPSIVNSVYGASLGTNSAIGILQTFTWVVPPDRYEEAIRANGGGGIFALGRHQRHPSRHEE